MSVWVFLRPGGNHERVFRPYPDAVINGNNAAIACYGIFARAARCMKLLLPW